MKHHQVLLVLLGVLVLQHQVASRVVVPWSDLDLAVDLKEELSDFLEKQLVEGIVTCECVEMN